MNVRNLPIALLAVLFSHSAGAGIEPYGFIRASAVGTSRVVDSFGNPNLSAPIKAAPATGAPDDGIGRSSFQVAQSRVGARIQAGEKVSGQLEFDFIDFTKDTPGTRAVPRLRIAALTYKISDTSALGLGQDWDIFSPVKPYTFNFVGLYFNAGNAGFMRPQFKYKQDFGKVHWELGIGLPGTPATVSGGGTVSSNGVNNAGFADTNLEKNLVPSLATSFSFRPDDKSLLGLSAIAGRLNFSGTSSGFYGISIFGETPVWAGGTVHAELFYGDKLGNTGALTLGVATAAGAMTEVGGYLTLQQELGESFRLQAGIGFDDVLTTSGAPVAGYNIANTIHSNIKASGAFAYRATPTTDFFLEGAQYFTAYNTGNLNAMTLEFGGVYNF